MKKTKELQELREKSLDELRALARELRLELDDERVKSYFGDQTSVNNVQSRRKKLARVLTLITEKEREEETKEDNKK